MENDYYNDLLVPAFYAGLSVVVLIAVIKGLRDDIEGITRTLFGEFRELAKAKWTPQSLNALGLIGAFIFAIVFAGILAFPVLGRSDDSILSESIVNIVGAIIVIFLVSLYGYLCAKLMIIAGRGK